MRGEMIITEVHRAREEGKAEGVIETYVDLIKDGFITIADAAKKLCMSEEAVKKLMV